jgi:predicted DNA-binding WGR domain protein
MFPPTEKCDMRRFELIEGSSSKFWEVDVAYADLTVRYGHIGTNGQTQTKRFANNTAAIKERDKLIEEKTGKGYSEVVMAATLQPASVPLPRSASLLKALERTDASVDQLPELLRNPPWNQKLRPRDPPLLQIDPSKFQWGANTLDRLQKIDKIPKDMFWLNRYSGKVQISLDMEEVDIAVAAAHGLKNLKTAKEASANWLAKYPKTAALTLLPLAFAEAKAQTRNARFAVRWLVANGHENMVREAAASYGAELSTALQTLLIADPLYQLPNKMPKLPSFFVAASFRRPELPDGSALPVSAVEHIGTMLMLHKAEAPYAGLAQIKALCTRESLAEFAWDLFEAWTGAGAPNKENWAFLALGEFGNDETARRLTPKIRAWPGEAAHVRAVTGLDVLAMIGSDAALMHLKGIADKVKFKGLQDRAVEKIDAIAEARGLTAEELADRLVPTLGLDEAGSCVLNFGPRKFVVSFDESLKPFVRDEQGIRLKDLPKALKNDEASLADAATESFKKLKRNAKAIASLQITRLELAMINRRRWSKENFQTFFLHHPVTRHLAGRLVWGVYEAGSDQKIVDAFRIAEDFSLANSDDLAYRLADDATVGIAHVLEMSADLRVAFGQLFADYGIMQPFRQLSREVFKLSDAELNGVQITRFRDKIVPIGNIMGLINRGWDRGAVHEAGWVGEFFKALGDNDIELRIEPGINIGDLSYEPKQKVVSIFVHKHGAFNDSDRLPLSILDPIIASEVLRDVELMAPYREA